MPTVLLVRHAQASFGSDDYDVLSADGRKQAALLADSLRRRGVAVDVIGCGSGRRHRETAALIASRYALDPPVVDPDWNEFEADAMTGRYGHAEASLDRRDWAAAPLSSKEFQVVLDSALHSWVADGSEEPGFESWADFASRGERALARVSETLERGQTALVVTSGGVIAALASSLLALPPAGFVELNRTAINTAISKVACGPRRKSLVSFNEHSHLESTPTLITYR
jgi:broad specificity phosphatase PhoE